jgi:hypothetical protein
MPESQYTREKALARRDITIRRANHFEEQRSPYGDKLCWVIDRGYGWQSLHAYATKRAALDAAEAEIEVLDDIARREHGAPSPPQEQR